MRDNTVTASYKRCGKCTTDKLYQWDEGQWLIFGEGFNLPPIYSVHFANQPMDGEATEEMGDADGVPIPDYYLSTGLPVYAWLYLHTGQNDGETVYMITIPVTRRAKPTDKGVPEIKVNTIDRAIEALNGAVEDAEDARDAAQAAAESVEQAATAIAGAVRFDTEQALTDGQQQQARENIGAAALGDIPTGSVRYDAEQALSEEEKAQARENIGAGTGVTETVTIDDYAGEIISDGLLEKPIAWCVYLPRLEGVEHYDLSVGVVDPETGTPQSVAYIDLTGLPEPFVEGWVEMLENGTIYITDAGGNTATLSDEPLCIQDCPFTVEAWADDSDLEVKPMIWLRYPISTKAIIENNAVQYSKAQELTAAQQAQARVNIGVEDILTKYNSVKLCDGTLPANSTVRGISFQWTGNSKCVVSGTLTSSYA